jgi:hypothetical protein
MKKTLLVFFAVIIVAACTKKNEPLELFSAESFAYSMEKGWEANASVRVKGFEQKETDGKYSASLYYTVDLQLPDGVMIWKIDSGTLDKTSAEKMTDLPVNTQLELDETKYKTGSYKIFFNVTDKATGKKSSLWSFFDLSK